MLESVVMRPFVTTDIDMMQVVLNIALQNIPSQCTVSLIFKNELRMFAFRMWKCSLFECFQEFIIL